jgi:hypothetical protein
MILRPTTAPKAPGAVPPGYLDAAGTAAALACAVHCALMPLALTLLPLAGLGFLADEAVEWALVGLSAVLGVTSLCLGTGRTARAGRSPCWGPAWRCWPPAGSPRSAKGSPGAFRSWSRQA